MMLYQIQPISRRILLTDRPQDWKEFCGEVCDVSEFLTVTSLTEFTRRNKEVTEIAGGYWLNTLKRLFILKALDKFVDEQTAIIHLESDVLLNVSSETICEILERIETVAIPRFSRNLGIASIVIAPSLNILKQKIFELEIILNSEKAFTNDMELLGAALNSSVLQELPTMPLKAWELKSGQKVIFDGAALGQYFFGQDPLHSNGKYVSGYKNPYFPLDPENFTWSISRVEKNTQQIKFTFENYEILPINLHNHAKRVFSEINIENPFWLNLINEANGMTPRIAQIAPPDSIHSRPISIRNKIRKARKMGLFRYLKLAVTRRCRNLLKRFGLQ